MPSPALTQAQLHALFDILTHAETYSEIRGFRNSSATEQYGYPLPKKIEDGKPEYAQVSSSPILQTLLSRLLLPIPPVQAVAADFWTVRARGILTKFAEADLSESYDKGAMGTRKTLATACSALIEGLGRGVLGGVPARFSGDLAEKTYDEKRADDLLKAWDDGVHALVYGDLNDEIYDFLAEHETLENHSTTIKTALDYIIIHLASFLHHTFVVSNDGPYLIKLLENLHKLIPYSLIKQTLRVSNAATMINGMVKLLLAKLSVGSVSNWLGLTKNAEDGMNLLQRIISMILSWDASDFQKQADKIERAKDGPGLDRLQALKTFAGKSREEHDAVRQTSLKNRQSIVASILSSTDESLLKDLSDDDHSQCMHYYSAILSVRDREEITNVLCRQNPDLLTQAIRDMLPAFDAIIRQLHDKIDLREHLTDAETFIGEFLEVAKGKRKSDNAEEGTPATVRDFVELLRRNKHLFWKFAHRVAKQCPDVWNTFRAYTREAVKEFRRPPTADSRKASSTDDTTIEADVDTPVGKFLSRGAGGMDLDLAHLFEALDDSEREKLLPVLESHYEYLVKMHEVTLSRMQSVLDQVHDVQHTKSPVQGGPGLYLARWQHLMNQTLITPEQQQGELRHGRDVLHATTLGKTGAEDAQGTKTQADKGAQVPLLQMPDASPVLKLLEEPFKDLLASFTSSKASLKDG